MSSIIRFAEIRDIPALLVLQHKIHRELELEKFYPFVNEDFFETMELLINLKQAVVAEHEGEVVGCVGFSLQPCAFNKNIITATEIGWSASEKMTARESIQMYEAVVKEAKRRGANFMKGCAPVQVKKLGTYYKRKKYTELETNYLLEL